MKRYKLFLLLAILLSITSCSDFLDREPDQLLSDEAVFNDPKMIKSALANIYGRARWGQKLEDSKSFIYLDEACLSNGGPDQTNEFANDLWRIYPYTLIRNINQLITQYTKLRPGNLGKGTIGRRSTFFTGMDLF